jgi:polyhydroxyalkanoate synthesis regulator phasin
MRNNRINPFTAAFALALLTSCAAQRPVPAEPPPPVPVSLPAPVPNEIDELMAYLLQAKMLGAAALADESSRLREDWSREQSDFARLKLALVLTGNGDDGELMELMEPMVQESSTAKPEMRALAILLYASAQERKRARENLASAQTRLREAHKNEEASQARADQLRKQVEELEKKLNALITIEKSLIERNDTPR